MRYWDASALVALVISEARTPWVRAALDDDPGIVTWAWSLVEITGAVERRTREGHLDREMRRDTLDRFGELRTAWDEVTDVEAVRSRALALLARHPLRAADAGQLGAAMLVADLGVPDLVFVCLDQRLSETAEREGLRVLPT